MAEQNSTSNALEWAEVGNYPLACRARFLEQTVALLTASEGRRRHFTLPEVDRILDDFLAWLAVFGE